MGRHFNTKEVDWLIKRACVWANGDPGPHCIVAERCEPCENCGWPVWLVDSWSAYAGMLMQVVSHKHPHDRKCTVDYRLHDPDVCHATRQMSDVLIMPKRADYATWLDD